jgi:hypothetical protein
MQLAFCSKLQKTKPHFRLLNMSQTLHRSFHLSILALCSTTQRLNFIFQPEEGFPSQIEWGLARSSPICCSIIGFLIQGQASHPTDPSCVAARGSRRAKSRLSRYVHSLATDLTMVPPSSQTPSAMGYQPGPQQARCAAGAPTQRCRCSNSSISFSILDTHASEFDVGLWAAGGKLDHSSRPDISESGYHFFNGFSRIN